MRGGAMTRTVEASVRLTSQALAWAVSLVLVAVLGASFAAQAARSAARADILARAVSLSCKYHLQAGSEEGTTVSEEAGYIALLGFAETESRPLLERCAA